MIQSLAIFPNQCALNSKPVIEAIITSAYHRGIQIKENSLDCDAALIWSVLWAGRMKGNQQVYQHYRSHGRSVIAIDVGSLCRGVTWKIGVNHINQQGQFGNHDALDADRPRKLGIELIHPRASGTKILVAGQHANSLQVADLPSQEHWITNIVNELRLCTDRSIIVRHHPRSKLNVSALPDHIEIQVPNKLQNTYDDFDFDLANIHAVVNFSSSPGVTAAIQGVRPIVSEHSLAYPVSIATADIDKPYQVDRQQWLIELCHTEYLTTEISSGLWLDRLQELI